MAARQPNQKTSNLLIALATLLLLVPASSLAESVIYAEDIKAAMNRHLATVIGEDGLFQIHDEVKDEDLSLRFVQIHDPVRQIGSDVYFACTDFHVDGVDDKLYDIDFWLRIDEGELKVFQTKIHKEPRSSLIYGWYKHPRYTFVNDEIQYIYEK
jgi:hypothetical protein